MRFFDFIGAHLKNHKSFVLLFLFLISGSQVFSQEWKLKSEEDGIKIFTRTTPNSKIQDVLCSVKIKTRISSLIALLKDVDGYPEWAYNCVESKLVELINDTTQIYYSHTAIPWPVSDRDFIFHSVMSQNPNTLVIKTHSVTMPFMLKEKEGIVRIKEGKTSWTLTPIAGGFVIAEYLISVDPGGLIPAWLVNSTITYGPLHTLQRIRTLLENGKYKDAAYPYVKELGN